jgi:hypothetical protein
MTSISTMKKDPCSLANKPLWDNSPSQQLFYKRRKKIFKGAFKL